MESEKLTKDQIEYLTLYFQLFKSGYYLATSKKLETIDQIIEVIQKGDFTFDDVFMIYIDQKFGVNFLEQETEIYWEDNMEMFDTENYFPNTNKRVGEGKWIKIRTENGFEVHYAKEARRKRRFSEELESAYKKLTNSFKKTLKGLESDLKVDEVETAKVKSKRKELENKIQELILRELIGLKLYEVKIYRTKTKVEYYLPYQYEVVENIDEFSDAYINNVPAVSVKSLYTSQNKDAVFYLQSRGISKKVAEMLATLKQTYFKVNMVEAMATYNNMLKERVKFVEV